MSDISLIQKEIEEIRKGNAQHYLDDTKNFKEIKDSIAELKNNRDDKHNELLEMLAPIQSHMKRVEPMIQSYEDNRVFMAELKSKGQVVLYCAGALLTVSAAYFVIKNWLISIK